MCERMREQVSLGLDTELSQLEVRMLDAHLVRCAACLAYKADVEGFTEQIRNAPYQVLERPVAVRRHRRLTTARLQVGVAAAFAFAALGLGSQLAGWHSHGSSFAEFDGRPTYSPPFSV
ncbi:MAG TPA: zf-HC2 domain-containing protein, partial [Gaiellaceae bacterium]|nr:zf-HC2 domain-containing protein [Gaiellaceae bacterium]